MPMLWQCNLGIGNQMVIQLHWWTTTQAPIDSTPVFVNQSSPSTQVSSLTIAGSYIFTLSVIDQTLVSSTVDVRVTVNNYNKHSSNIK